MKSAWPEEWSYSDILERQVKALLRLGYTIEDIQEIFDSEDDDDVSNYV